MELKAGVANGFGPVAIVKPFLLRAPGTTPPGQQAPSIEAEEAAAAADEEGVRVCLCLELCRDMDVGGCHHCHRSLTIHTRACIYTFCPTCPHTPIHTYAHFIQPASTRHADLVLGSEVPRLNRTVLLDKKSGKCVCIYMSLIWSRGWGRVCVGCMCALSASVHPWVGLSHQHTHVHTCDADAGMELSWTADDERRFVDIQVGAH